MSTEGNSQPKKPLSALKLFEQEYVQYSQQSSNGQSQIELSKHITKAFKELPIEKQQEFQEQASRLMERYEQEIEEFKQANKENNDLIEKISPSKHDERFAASSKKSAAKGSTKKGGANQRSQSKKSASKLRNSQSKSRKSSTANKANENLDQKEQSGSKNSYSSSKK